MLFCEFLVQFPVGAGETELQAVAMELASNGLFSPPGSLAAKTALPTLAQVPPRTVEPRPLPPLPPPTDLLEPTPPDPSLTVPPAVQPEDTVPPGSEVSLVVDRFDVVGSTVFSEAELQAVLAPFVGRPLTLTELLQARTVITQLYVDRGYVSSGAFIPPQEPEQGTVTIQVIEGSLSDIQVEGTTRLNPSYITSRLALAATPPLRVDRLVDALRLLQLDPLIASISGDLSAGVEPGTSRLTVTVTEADSVDVDIATSNSRPTSVGTWERGLFLNQRNLTGHGDGLRLGYLNTDGSDRLSVRYQIPINPRNGTVGARFEYTRSQVVSPPADVLGITTNSTLLDLFYRQPIILTPTQELALTLTGSWERSRTVFLKNILGEAIPFPAFGANANGEVEVFVLRFAQDWVQRGSRSVVAARSQFNLGLGGSTPENLTGDAPDGEFFSWLGQAQWARLLGPDTLLLVRGEAQLSSDTLPSQELFGLGGQGTVRGYSQDRLLSDNALLASAEVRLPVLRDRDRQGLLQVVPFFDLGTGWNTRLPNPNLHTLAGTGVGLLWTEGDYWSARLDWGIPLNGSESGNSWQASGIYFSIALTTF
ncbi:ShlB/FhaC/HecB family hemolysin secretion/activation protein [Nodosilinea sp. AN01ver1]|uniref:ShlB/FhaC/HecB family hemolysin secretion/activation protein n=1 Tax=Nodosilinea sp. AN01ver1 TaxID=3423362 RepID=UPI003D3114FC